MAGLLSVALHQAQLHASLALRTEELEAQNAELDAFAHTVAHDLKNPLGVLTTYAEFLDLYFDRLDPEQMKQAAGMAARSAQKAINIVNNLLLLASTNKQEVELRPLDMAKILEETLYRLRNMILEYQAEIGLPGLLQQAAQHFALPAVLCLVFLIDPIQLGEEGLRPILLGGGVVLGPSHPT